MMNHNVLFEKTSPIKLFFLAAIPGGISMLAASLYGLLDGMFVGRFLGETSFAALNLAFPFVIINFSQAHLFLFLLVWEKRRIKRQIIFFPAPV